MMNPIGSEARGAAHAPSVEQLRAAYETLREQSFGSRRDVRDERGLGLLMRRGMVAWIEAWSSCAPPTADSLLKPSAERVEALGVASELGRELAVLVAGMVLRVGCREVTPWP